MKWCIAPDPVALSRGLRDGNIQVDPIGTLAECQVRSLHEGLINATFAGKPNIPLTAAAS